jgi:hypothetical protein
MPYNTTAVLSFTLDFIFSLQLSRVTDFQGLRSLVVYFLAYPFTFGCLVSAKLLVLDRLTDFSKLKTHAFSRWDVFGRVLIGAIVAGNIVGLSCNIASSIFLLKVAVTFEQFASYNVSSTAFNAVFAADFEKGVQMAAVFFGFETIILPIIVIAFFVVGAASVRRIRIAMTAAQKAQGLTTLGASDPASGASVVSGRRLKQQIVGTCGILFLSFSIRTVFAMMLSMGAVFGNFDTEKRCDEKGNNFALMTVWIFNTPEFFFLVTLLCQPMTLLVALWGMTSGQTIAVMRDHSLDVEHSLRPATSRYTGTQSTDVSMS